MFKKLLIASAILATTSSLAFAEAAPYIGAGLGVTNNTSSSSSFRGVTGTVMGGYGATVNQNIYLGGEVFGTGFTTVLDNNTKNSPSLRTTYGYGASFIPGLMLSDHTMTFVRLGAVRTRFSNLNSTSTGGQLGLGMQTNITQNWDLRGEYDYTSYGKVSGISTVSDQFNLGLVYKVE